MEVRCDKCQARYRVDDGRIGPRGLTVRCGRCQNTFNVFRPAPSHGRPATNGAPLQAAMAPLTPLAPPPAPARPAASAPAEEPPPAPAGVHAPLPAASGPASRREPKAAGVAARAALVLAVVALVLGGGIAVHRLIDRPPRAAIALLAAAQADARLDSLASLAGAEAKARDALRAAGEGAHFPEGTAALALIELQWADALNEQAARMRPDTHDDAGAGLRAEAKTRMQAAFELLLPAWKADQESLDLQLALADYYRSQRSHADMVRYLASAPGDPRAALIHGMADAQVEGGAERAIPRLQAALAASPESARIHYRLALAYAALEDAAGTRAQLQQTLKLSPLHERARALLDELGAASARGPK